MRITSKFPLGRLVATSNAVEALRSSDIELALSRHAMGDWGEVEPDDWEANEQALRLGGRLLSVYQSVSGARFWIITERDRSATTVLLPEDY